MKNKKTNTVKMLSILAIIALVVIIGFTMAACGGDSGGGGTAESGQYAKKDVLGNTYSISVGSNASRAAVPGDRFSMAVKGRDDKTRETQGSVKAVSDDGTLTLETDNHVEFTAVVKDNSLESVASDAVEIPLGGATAADNIKLTPRSFDSIFLRAHRWSSSNTESGSMRGEQYGSGNSVLVKDFPTNVSELEMDDDRYTITISGTLDRALSRVSIEVQGLTENGQWIFLANNNSFVSIPAGSFNKTITLDHITSDPVSHSLLAYKEIILQVTEVINKTFLDHPDWSLNVPGSIPADIPDGQIMATISNFNIALKDKNRPAFFGNMNDYSFGFWEDGFSIDYRQAVWSLSADNISKAKQTGVKFEFTMMNTDIGESDWSGPTLAFIWQDPVRGLWWQDMTTLSQAVEINNSWKYQFFKGTTWDASQNKLSVDLSQVIKDNKFAASTKVNFIIACWWNKDAECKNIDDLSITSASILQKGESGDSTGDSTSSLTSVSDAATMNVTEGSRTGIMKVDMSAVKDNWSIASYSLSSYKNKEITVILSVDVKREGNAGEIRWQINNATPSYPTVAVQSNAAAGTWYTMSGTYKLIIDNDYPVLYLNNDKTSDTTFFYIDNFTVKIIYP